MHLLEPLGILALAGLALARLDLAAPIIVVAAIAWILWLWLRRKKAAPKPPPPVA